MKQPLSWHLFTAISWVFSTAISLTGAASALAQVEYIPVPPDQGAPDGRQRGGATRGDCLADQTAENLTALVPTVNGIVWSQAKTATPRFFFVLPPTTGDDRAVEFVLQDSLDNYVFRQQFAPVVNGIIEIPIMIEETALQPGENYAWTFALYCDVNRPSSSVSVAGTLQRVTAGPILDAAATPLEQIEAYAAAGLWHAALGLAFDLYRTDPSNPDHADLVINLLEQAGLTDISLSAPIPILNPQI